MKKTTIICVLVFLAGAGLFVNARFSGTTSAEQTERAKSFVITYLVSRGGTPTGLAVRAVRATGEWKETMYDFQGVTTIRSATADAQYSMRPGDEARQWVSNYSLDMDRAFRSTTFLESHPDFARRERVAGYDAYLHRAEFEDGNFLVESAHSPLLGIHPIRLLSRVKGHPEKVTEALRVEFRDVTEDETAMADVPTEFTMAEQKAAAMRSSGLGEAADSLLRTIHNAKER
jgi:hypothetical protein